MKRSFFLILMLTASIAWAGEADVIDVELSPTGTSVFRFAVTVQHADTGWDHYADKWEVIGPDGTILATRILAHPHVNEQPFTRALSGVKIPAGVDSVTIRAHDRVHGYGGKTVTAPIPR